MGPILHLCFKSPAFCGAFSISAEKNNLARNSLCLLEGAMSISLGCNYSAPLKSLLKTETVDVDWVKIAVRERLHAELTDALRYRPVLLHVLGRAGSASPIQSDLTWDTLADLVTQAGSPHHAIHLALEPEDWTGPVERETQSPEQRPRMVEMLIRGVESVKNRSSVPVLVENVPYYGWRGTVRCAVEAEAIHAVTAAAGVGLLLDLAHVRVAADHLGMDVKSYLTSLPLELVREIHVNGPRVVPEQGLSDLHFEMLETDYDLLAETLEIANPDIITLEYGGTGPRYETEDRNSIAALARQLSRIRKIIDR
jgi:uncharacterized protein (UPF0276 family)